MEISGKKFLVIGGAGFIGSHVVAELLRHEVSEVVVFDNFSRGKEKYLVDSLKDTRCKIFPKGGDIREIELLEEATDGVDGVFHLAAMWLLQCKDYPRAAFDVNIEGTFNVLQACVKNQVKKIVYSSSASVYGDAITEPMTEDHPFNNRNFYGATKIAGESMLRAFNDRFGLDYLSLRYMNVYGPNQDQLAAYTGVIPTMLNMIDANQQPVINGDGTQSYDFIEVRDVARANILAMESNETDLHLNVASGIKTSIRELCDLILDLKGSNLKVKYNPYNEDDSRRLVQNRLGSTSEAKLKIGFESSIELTDGIQSLIDWRSSIG
jgi:UDP-glucose 4-epimerase